MRPASVGHEGELQGCIGPPDPREGRRRGTCRDAPSPSTSVLVLVNEGEATDASLFVALAAAAEQEPHRRADPARYDKPGAQRRRGKRRRRDADLGGVAQRVDRVRETLALELDVAADRLRLPLLISFGHWP